MKRTNKLKFIQKDEKFVLQQWWTNEYIVNLENGEVLICQKEKGEWRDVPIESETK